MYCIYRCFNTQNYIYPFQNLSLGFILKIFLKFRKFQPRYSYKIYSYKKKECITLRTYVPRSRFPVSVIIDDLSFRISWCVSASLKAGQFGRIQWNSLKNKNRWNIHIQTTALNSHARQRRGRRDWNISLTSMIFF